MAKNTPKTLPPSKPRNFVVKNAQTSGAGAHKDKKKSQKNGEVKHKKNEFGEASRRFSTLDMAIMEGGHSLHDQPVLRKQKQNEPNQSYLGSVLAEALKRK